MHFSSINFCIFGIPAYFFCAGVGLVVAVSAFIILLSAKKYSLKLNLRILVISIICMIVTARFAGILSASYRNIGMGKMITISNITKSGIVFYGGLFGLLYSYKYCLKKLNQDKQILDILVVTIPLFHSIARIGCFLAGCCFGKENQSCFSIEYTTSILGVENTAQRIPVQLYEALFNFLLFLYLLYLIKLEDWKQKNIVEVYLLIYSVGRFVLEFFRGDTVRGIINGISFSQLISISIWLNLLCKTYIKHKIKEERL